MLLLLHYLITYNIRSILFIGDYIVIEGAKIIKL